MRVDALGLSLHQNWDVPSTVWSFPSCYVIAAVIRNDSSRSLSPFLAFGSMAPPWQSKIALMKNPLGTRKGRPDVFGVELFGCGILLNRIISEKHIILPPGDSVKGVWMAEGKTVLPLEYHDRDTLKIHLTLFDQRSRCDRKPFWVTVERSPDETERIRKLEGMS